jgi:hypothetical protein
LQLAVKAEQPREATTEEVKGMQHDLVVQLWSSHPGPLSKGVRRRRHLNSAVASPNASEA